MLTLELFTDGPVLTLAGRFDARSTEVVRTRIYELLAAYGDVVVDLRGVDAVDLTALRVLAAASFAAGREGHHLTLRGCNGGVRRLLCKSHLNRLVELERDAVASA